MRMAASARSESRDSPASTTPQRTSSKASSRTSKRPDFHKATPPAQKIRAAANQAQRLQCLQSPPLPGFRGRERALIGKGRTRSGKIAWPLLFLDDLYRDFHWLDGIVAVIGFLGDDFVHYFHAGGDPSEGRVLVVEGGGIRHDNEELRRGRGGSGRTRGGSDA